MDDGFETWARSEIGRLRAEAEQMELVLARFLTARGPLTATPEHPSPAAHVAPSRTPLLGRRISKNQPIFDAFERAGPKGLNIDDVERVARENGLNTNRNALRALCWNGKQDKRLISIAAGRYAIAHPTETADTPPNVESAASAREAHNHHREGDGGGGI